MPMPSPRQLIIYVTNALLFKSSMLLSKQTSIDFHLKGSQKAHKYSSTSLNVVYV